MSDGYVEDEPQTYQVAAWAAEPVLVKSADEAAPSPEFSSCMTWNIPQAVIGGQPVQILQRRKRREKAKIILVTLGGATSVVINNTLAPLQGATPQGATVLNTTAVIEWESQQPCYAIAIGGGPAILSVIDEAYADR